MKQNGIFRNGMMKNVILHHGLMKNAILHHGMMKNAILHHGVMKNGICSMVSDAKLCNNVANYGTKVKSRFVDLFTCLGETWSWKCCTLLKIECDAKIKMTS